MTEAASPARTMQSQPTTFSRRDKALLTLRPVSAADAPAMQAFVAGLGAAARRFRFHGCVNGCAEAFLRHLTEVDGTRHVAFVAYLGARLVGEARYFVTADGRSAEFAIAVADDCRGQGVAGALMDALFKAARRAGLERLFGEVLDDNERMAAFMRRQGFEIDLADWETAAAGVARWHRPVRATLRLPSLPRLADVLPRLAGLLPRLPSIPLPVPADRLALAGRHDVAR